MRKFIIGLIVGLILSIVGTKYISQVREVILSRSQIIQEFLKLSPVDKVASYEVSTRVQLFDDYHENHTILGFEIPDEFSRLWSQITTSGWVDITAVYGYPNSDFLTTPHDTWGDPQLLYYQINENNIDRLITGLGVGSQASTKRVVNDVLNQLHVKLKEDFSTNAAYIGQAKAHTLCAFANVGCMQGNR